MSQIQKQGLKSNRTKQYKSISTEFVICRKTNSNEALFSWIIRLQVIRMLLSFISCSSLYIVTCGYYSFDRFTRRVIDNTKFVLPNFPALSSWIAQCRLVFPEDQELSPSNQPQKIAQEPRTSLAYSSKKRVRPAGLSRIQHPYWPARVRMRICGKRSQYLSGTSPEELGTK